MSSTLSAQRAAILSLLDIVEGKVSKPKPDAIKLLRERAYDACESIDRLEQAEISRAFEIVEWVKRHRDLIVKAKQMQEAGE